MSDNRARRMNAYYFGFGSTGVEAIDRLLSAVACAGKAYHHTRDWGEEREPYEPDHRGECPVDWIWNAAADAADEIARLRAENARLQADAATFHEDYRRRCDVKTKALHVEIERLTNKLNTDSQHFELECRKAQIERLSQENDTLRALLIECREAYRRPWDYGFTAVTATDQRVFAAWLARLDALLGKDER